MFILKLVTFLSLEAFSVLSIGYKLHELTVEIHRKSYSENLYFIGIDEQFLLEFMKTEISIPISTFDADFPGKFQKIHNAFLVFQVPINNSKVLENLLENLQVRKFVLISAENLSSLKRYFSFFAQRKFTRIFGVLRNTTFAYAYLPYFTENPVRQIAKDDPLPDALKDLNGFTLKTTIHNDVPRTFWYRDKSGQKSIGGIYGQIFVQFLKRHNATFEEISVGNLLSEPLTNATLSHEFHVSMNAYHPHKFFDHTYPVKVEEMAVMVPYKAFVPPHEYLLRPFSPTTWLCIAVSVVFITSVNAIIDSITITKWSIWSSFSETYLKLLNLSTQRPITSNYRFHLQVLLFSFIIGQLFGTFFQSFLTVGIKVTQFDTIQDLADAGMRVIIPDSRWDTIKYDRLPSGLEEIILPLDFSIVAPQLMSMRNTSFAYIIDEDKCRFFIDFQALYRPSLFRRAREAINVYHIGYLLPSDHSEFKEILNDFIVEIKETGLIQKWNLDVLYQAKTEGIGENIYKDMEDDDGVQRERDHHVPLSLHQLQFAWNSLAIGLAISIVVFLFEFVFGMMLPKLFPNKDGISF